jgi:hypothetical protein
MKKLCWHILTTVICIHNQILIFYLYHQVDGMKLEVFHQINLKLWHMVMHKPTPSLTLQNQNHCLRKLTKPYITLFKGLWIFCFLKVVRNLRETTTCVSHTKTVAWLSWLSVAPHRCSWITIFKFEFGLLGAHSHHNHRLLMLPHSHCQVLRLLCIAKKSNIFKI